MLQSCGECGGKVSTEAEACPHCGAPTTTARRRQVDRRPLRPMAGQPKSSSGLIVVVVCCLAGAGAAFLVWQHKEATARAEAAQEAAEEKQYNEHIRIRETETKARRMEEAGSDPSLNPLERLCAQRRIEHGNNTCAICDGKGVEFTERGLAVKCQCCRGDGHH